MTNNFWFIFMLCVLSITLGALGMLFYMTIIGNYSKADDNTTKTNYIDNHKDTTNYSYDTQYTQYNMPVENEYEYEEDDSTSKYTFKNKCVMVILFVVCAVVGGYFGYATMKSVDSIIKENHHRPTINSMVVDFHKSYIA